MNLAEKYRPKTLEEIIGQDEIVESLRSNLKTYGLNHMIFSGPSGTGKTTIALILSQMYGVPLHETNASNDRGIEIIRGEIKRLSMTKGKRIILLDEGDQLTSPAQSALRRTMEKTPDAIFIITGNNSWKIIEPIKSRCSVYDFRRIEDADLLRQILKICKAEEIEIDEDARKGLIELLKQANGDMRKAINTLTKVIDKDKKITEKTVLSFRKPKLAAESLKVALEGDLEKAKNLIEDSFIERRSAIGGIINEFYDSISDLKDIKIKARLFVKLSEVENACKTESDPTLPLVHLVGFISYAWLVPNLSNKCPVLMEEKIGAA